MTDELKIKHVPLGEWWPPEFEMVAGNPLMEFPEQIASIQRIGDRLFVTMVSGKIIDCTDLLGEAKH